MSNFENGERIARIERTVAVVQTNVSWIKATLERDIAGRAAFTRSALLLLAGTFLSALVGVVVYLTQLGLAAP